MFRFEPVGHWVAMNLIVDTQKREILENPEGLPFGLLWYPAQERIELPNRINISVVLVPHTEEVEEALTKSIIYVWLKPTSFENIPPVEVSSTLRAIFRARKLGETCSVSISWVPRSTQNPGPSGCGTCGATFRE